MPAAVCSEQSLRRRDPRNVRGALVDLPQLQLWPASQRVISAGLHVDAETGVVSTVFSNARYNRLPGMCGSEMFDGLITRGASSLNKNQLTPRDVAEVPIMTVNDLGKAVILDRVLSDSEAGLREKLDQALLSDPVTAVCATGSIAVLGSVESVPYASLPTLR